MIRLKVLMSQPNRLDGMQTGFWKRASSRGLGPRLLLLAMVVLIVAVPVAAVGALLLGTCWKAAGVALVACLASALLAHVAGEYPRGDMLIMARMAIQMVVRTALPFLVALWGIYFVDPPFEKSLVFYMILFYMVGLVAEVQLSLNRLNVGNIEIENQTSNE